MKRKRLHIIRHAKSDWHHEGLSDHDRPLNDRGERDAPMAADRFFFKFGTPDKWLASSAQRAQATAHYFAAPHEGVNIITQKEIYHASLGTLMDILNSIEGNPQEVVIFGHNPGFSQLASYLSGEMINMPTCCVVSLDLFVDEWSHLTDSTCSVLDIDYPKKHFI
ncbi:MAG: histidine phosphatase family protein [Flavobacteriales bacterium]|nr:histidine phosphatase family protein [Flavobacteriales bacterium]MDG1767398.1 histidine phosphatase family protein [Flavobacteriales bacterium]